MLIFPRPQVQVDDTECNAVILHNLCMYQYSGSNNLQYIIKSIAHLIINYNIIMHSVTNIISDVTVSSRRWLEGVVALWA